ncbi:MAG TPA: NUDIX hydrolase [Gammaproteobacteria bacterium]|nr:NUDIX hydrolase [Gammaproteobacteria bacterium]
MSRRTIYRGSVVDLGIEPVTLPNGETLELEVVRHPGGAAVVAVDEHGRVCLLRQYRHAAGGWLWELPAGKIDPPEPPEETARRELQEEAGLTAADWYPLGHFLSTPGFCDERIHLYLARRLGNTASARERHEVIEVHWLEFPRALEQVCNGEIVDGKTMLGLLLAQQRGI